MFRPIRGTEAGERLSPGRLIHGLYAITPDCADTPGLLRRTGQALAGGASVLQYRNKTANPMLRLEQAQALRELTLSVFGAADHQR